MDENIVKIYEKYDMNKWCIPVLDQNLPKMFFRKVDRFQTQTGQVADPADVQPVNISA